jgi:hypothetical protein
MTDNSGDSPAKAMLEDQLQDINNLMVNRDYREALAKIEKIPDSIRTPLIISAYALCMAEVNSSYKTSAILCHEAIKKEPKNPEHYYRQGKILLMGGRTKDAIWILRMGLRYGRHKGIIETLGSLGIRRPPPISFLPRSNPLNKYLGLLLSRLNLR